MGSHTVFKLILAAAVVLAAAAPVDAQTPTPPPLPYTFEPAEIPDTEAPVVLGDLIKDVTFINRLGSIVTTVWVLLDNFAGGAGVLGYLVVFLMGLAVLRWIARYVYNRRLPRDETVSGAAENDSDTSLKTQWARFGHELARRKPRF